MDTFELVTLNIHLPSFVSNGISKEELSFDFIIKYFRVSCGPVLVSIMKKSPFVIFRSRHSSDFHNVNTSSSELFFDSVSNFVYASDILSFKDFIFFTG